jgi:lipopolysaccharide export system permease protein
MDAMAHSERYRMSLSKIWERYFIRETLMTFFLFIVCFYGLYILIDYASHTSALPQHRTQIHWRTLGEYYFYIFVSQAEILIPFAFLIATIKTLCQLNMRNELVALMAGGIPLKTLLRPFLFLGLMFTCLIFINEQVFLPMALKKLRHIEDVGKSQRKNRTQSLVSTHNILLEDGSILLYQSYDTARQLFNEVYWIRSVDELYHMKSLSPYTQIPIGRFVDHFTRNSNGNLVQNEAVMSQYFPEIRFNLETLHESLISAEDLSITALWNKLPAQSSQVLSEKESRILSAFYWKLAIPWLSLLAVIGVAPICTRFTRHLPVFFIFVGCVFGLLAFYLLIDASLVLAERQVIPPAWAIWFPFFTISSFFGFRFLR